MSALSKLSFVVIFFLLSAYLTGQSRPNFPSVLEDYVTFMDEANRKGNKYLVDFSNMKDTVEKLNREDFKYEYMILEESIQNSLMVGFITSDMISFINLSGYIQFIDKDQLRGEALELIKIDVIENYKKRIDVMIKAATQNSLLTNSRSLLKVMDQFKEDLNALKEKLIEIEENFLTDRKTAYNSHNTGGD
jgi:hypothetical protein